MADREAFEAWERSEGLPVDRFQEDDRFSFPAPGRYTHKMVDAHWAAWQAAIKAEREACAVLCDEKAAKVNSRWIPEDCAAAIRARS